MRPIYDGRRGRDKVVRILSASRLGWPLPNLRTAVFFGRPGAGKSSGAEVVLQLVHKRLHHLFPAEGIQVMYLKHTTAAIVERYDPSCRVVLVLADDLSRGLSGRKTMHGAAQEAVDDFNEIRHELWRRQVAAGAQQGGLVVLVITVQVLSGVILDFKSNAHVKAVCSTPGEDEWEARVKGKWLKGDERMCRILDEISGRELDGVESAKSEYVFATGAKQPGYMDLNGDYEALRGSGFWDAPRAENRAWEAEHPHGVRAHMMPEEFAGLLWGELGPQKVTVDGALAMAYEADPEMSQKSIRIGRALHNRRVERELALAEVAGGDGVEQQA